MHSLHAGVAICLEETVRSHDLRILNAGNPHHQLDELLVFHVRSSVSGVTRQQEQSLTADVLSRFRLPSRGAVVWEMDSFDPSRIGSLILEYIDLVSEHLLISMTFSAAAEMVAVEIARGSSLCEVYSGVVELDETLLPSTNKDASKGTAIAAPNAAVLLWERGGLGDPPRDLQESVGDISWRYSEANTAKPSISLLSQGSQQALEEADVVVVVGAGASTPDDMKNAATIAQALGAALGGTRLVTDAQVLPHNRQIGTTGVEVSPSVLLSFGVSGAIQHLAGIEVPPSSISVNLDQFAPMSLAVTHSFALDAHEVLQALSERLRPREHPT